MPISTMKRLTVLSLASDADAIVRKLMNLRCVEIQNTEIGDGEILSAHFDTDGQKSRADGRLRKIRETIPLLNRYTTRKKGLGRSLHRVNREAFLSDGRAEEAWKTVEKTLSICERMKAIEGEVTRMESQQEALQPWLEYDVVLSLDGSEKTTLILGSYPSGVSMDAAMAELLEAGAYAELVSEEKNGTFLSVLCHKTDEERVNRVLASRGFVKTTFRDIDTTAAVAHDGLVSKLSELESEREQQEELLRVYAENLDLIEILCDIEETNANAARHLHKLATTKKCAVLDGWIPKFTHDAVVEVLASFECAYEIADPAPEDEPPVLLRNNRFAMNFEWVIGMYAYPKYGAFDPTFIMSIFYFVLFGLMFADVGYGLLLVAGCFLGIKLLNPKPTMRRMLSMFAYCGVGSIVMGLIFGGWFGDLPTAIMTNMLGLPVDTGVGHFFGSGLWFNPLDDPMTFLILSLGVGAVHLIAGMVIRFVVLCREGHAAEAICTIVPYWVLFAGLIMLVLGMLGDPFAIASKVGPYVALAGAVLILLLNGYGRKNIFSRIIGGLGGLYGLINYASDLLSYSRILALGLVAGVIAKVINLITMLGATGAVGFVVMIIILLVGHALNLAINVLGTFVHTSRLQYIEFFGKFYEDGGRPFEPAAVADQYSENL